jgi:phosphinothricin acetyltransferase
LLQVIRLATTSDAAAIAAIYAPFCTTSTITFETVALSPDAMAERIRKIGEHYPWLVMDVEGEIAGYAYAAPYHERAAFRWTVVVSVYVDERFRRRGIARKLYLALFGILKVQGFVQAIAGITLPNEPSVQLHESLGFYQVGMYPHVGFKLGAWRDVGWWQLQLLDPLPTNPSEPIAISEAARRPSFDRYLSGIG